MRQMLIHLRMHIEISCLRNGALSTGLLIGLVWILVPTQAFAQFPLFSPQQSTEILQNGFTHVVATDSLLICGLDEGLGFVSFIDPELTHEFELLSFYHEDMPIRKLKLFDSVLIAQFADGIFKFYDITNPPEIKVLGKIEYDKEFLDFSYRDGSLYFAEEFRGVTKYQLSNFSSYSFSDSTMRPIRTVQIEIRGDTLYVLDDYNGILRITEIDAGLQSQLNYLWLPSQANSMTLGDSSIILSEGVDGFKTIAYDGNGFVGEFLGHLSISYAYQTLETDSNYIVISSSSKIEVIPKNDPSDVQFFEIIGNTQGACLVERNGIQAFISPANGRGLTGLAMNVENFPVEFAVYDHPGPIRALEYSSDELFTGGGGNLFETYSTSSAGELRLLRWRTFPPDISAGTLLSDTLYLVDNSSGYGLLWLVFYNRAIS
ncbi:hypothetical protein JYU03_00550, partial [bacterium AH-315-F03]|nr:hypothetical protein [bacterium AH-315-F03]